MTYSAVKLEMLLHGQTVKQNVVLRTQTQTPSDPSHFIPDIKALNVRRSSGWPYQACQHGHGSCFPSPVVSQQGRHLILIHFKVEIIHSHPRGKNLGQPFQFHAYGQVLGIRFKISCWGALTGSDGPCLLRGVTRTRPVPELDKLL